jgi:Transglycosylase SLT domain
LAAKIGFAMAGAVCAALIAPALGEDRDFPASAPSPVARPADLGDAGRHGLVDGMEGGEKGLDKPSEKLVAASQELRGRQNFIALLRREAARAGVPLDIAEAVVSIESGYDPSVIGDVGEIGLMQVRPETAALLGFRGDLAELAKPEVNIHYGVAYLAEAWRLANGDLCRALMKYRAGHGEELMSPLSATYCWRARAHLAEIGSPFAAGVSVPIAFDPMEQQAQSIRRARRRGLPPIRTAATSRAFWAAHEARVAAVSRRIEAKWRRMASR